MKRPGIGAIVLARLSSSRLPGKALSQVKGHPLIYYVFKRLEHICGNSIPVVLATSEEASDDALVDYAQSLGVPAFRGELESVLSRMCACALDMELDYFIRVNGDSPFISPELYHRALSAIDSCSENIDLVTNLLPRSFPYGISIEIIKTQTAQSILDETSVSHYHEHPTSFIYDHPNRFSIINLENHNNEDSPYKLTVDTREDLERFNAFISECKKDWVDVSYVDALNFYQSMETTT